MKKESYKGALVATLVVVLASALTVSINSSIGGLLISPVLAFLCVILGSILTIFQRTRQFAVGFLIASAILIFVSAGVCVVALRMSSGMA